MPGWNQLRKEYADKPVVFIAVNSGTSKGDVEGFAKGNKFEWPIFVDERREFEKRFGFEISLSNIYQWQMREPESAQFRGIPFDLPAIKAAVDAALPKAKMFFDGIAVPEKLKPLARELEMGFYEPAAGELFALAAKPPKDLQEPVAAMVDRLKPVAEALLEKAKALEGEGRKGAAYFEYAKASSWFRKTEYEKTATAAMAVLKKEKPVQDEIAARQLLDQARTLLASAKKPDQANGQGILAALRKKYPDTDAAKDAAALAK